MSIDLEWAALTTGASGAALSLQIRDFIHSKFQSVPLPRFIKSVVVHDFAFGDAEPSLELRDITDPLPEFYDLDSDDESDNDVKPVPRAREPPRQPEPRSPFLGVSTPGILSAPSSMHYFSTHLGGTQTPASVAAGSPVPSCSGLFTHGFSGLGGIASRPALSRPPSSALFENLATRPVLPKPPTIPRRLAPRPDDVQAVFRIRYAGAIRINLTTEILLDYPMPSFVSIPVKLSITGLAFDGVGVLAHIRKRVHFCFLGQEDANALADEGEDTIGGLLREINVESEIGLRDGGKQSLKNVGKVEKFVLDQVRRIFDDELVYPSYWTFLV